jgi:5-methylcytosine-specific restriction protein A
VAGDHDRRGGGLSAGKRRCSPPALQGDRGRGGAAWWATARGGGRQAQALAGPGCASGAQVLREEPLCRLCLARGISRASVMVDHIRPLAWAGTDERTNKQGLCKPCPRSVLPPSGPRRGLGLVGMDPAAPGSGDRLGLP